MATTDIWPAGTTGILLSEHDGDREAGYKVRVKLLKDSPPTHKTIRVELLEDWYCLEVGDRFKTARELFTPE